MHKWKKKSPTDTSLICWWCQTLVLSTSVLSELCFAHKDIATCSLPFVLITQTTYHLSSDMTKCMRTKPLFDASWNFCRYTTVSFEVASTFLVAPNHRNQRQSAIFPRLLVMCFSSASTSNHEHFLPNFALFIFYSVGSTMEIPWNVLPSDYRCKQWKHSTKDFRTLSFNAKPPGYYVSVAPTFCFFIHSHIHPPKTWFLQYS